MRHSYEPVCCRRGMNGALGLRLCWGLGLTLAIGIWTASAAWAQVAIPTAVTFYAVAGGTNPPSQAITVARPSGSLSTSFTATDTATWVTESPSSGTISSSAQIAVTVNTAGLAAGTYTSTVIFKISTGQSSIPVTLIVSPPPPSTTSSTTLTLTGSVTLSWDPDTNTSGYKVYYGTAPGLYPTAIDVGNVTTYAVNNLLIGTNYFFVVTAYNSAGESLPSTYVSKTPLR
jgi:hypothetical protein